MTDRRPVWGLVLAGGQSRRMGSDKALLEKGGRTQLARTVGLLERHLDRVFISARADQAHDAERARFEQISDRYEDLGPVAGILSAMDAYPAVDWLVAACDLPNADDRNVEALLAAHAPDTPFTAFASSYNGLPEPLFAIYGADAAAMVADFVADCIRCPRKMIIRSGVPLLRLPDRASLDYVNTPEDLAVSGAR
ncbi:MAG: molybdenum cofactor guanylyltransferase, partial [Pseudomonadota bacterium]